MHCKYAFIRLNFDLHKQLSLNISLLPVLNIGYLFIDEDPAGALLCSDESAVVEHSHPVYARVGDAVAVEVGAGGVVAVNYSYRGVVVVAVAVKKGAVALVLVHHHIYHSLGPFENAADGWEADRCDVACFLIEVAVGSGRVRRQIADSCEYLFFGIEVKDEELVLVPGDNGDDVRGNEGAAEVVSEDHVECHY